MKRSHFQPNTSIKLRQNILIKIQVLAGIWFQYFAVLFIQKQASIGVLQYRCFEKFCKILKKHRELKLQNIQTAAPNKMKIESNRFSIFSILFGRSEKQNLTSPLILREFHFRNVLFKEAIWYGGTKRQAIQSNSRQKTSIAFGGQTCFLKFEPNVK